MMPLGALRRFFAELKPQGRRLIIGFSGGPDSYALLDGCARLQTEYGFTLVVAHLDHGWRPTSASEALELERQVAERGLKWVSQRISMDPGSNLEERARDHRLAFFSEVMQQESAHAVLLGHQADDLVETTLKRVLEGAALDKLHGLRPVHNLGQLLIWRPFLSVSRQEIERYVRQKRLPALRDPTNTDPRFLRARMREQLIPQIESLFGKGIRRPLMMLAERSQALEKERGIRQVAEPLALSS